MVSPQPETGFAPDIGGDLQSFEFRALARSSGIPAETGPGETARRDTTRHPTAIREDIVTTTWESPAETLGEHIARLSAIESAADTVHAWQPMVMPGLLQTYAYACAAIHGASLALPLEAVSARAEKRARRLDNRPGRTAEFIIDESALYRPVGGWATLVDQLEHLLAVAALQPALTLRILPQGIEAHPGLAGAFALYRAIGQRAVFVESLTSSEITTRPDDVAAYASAWERLARLAMSPQQSLNLIDATRGTLCRRLETKL